jgi:hypothetical protein
MRSASPRPLFLGNVHRPWEVGVAVVSLQGAARPGTFVGTKIAVWTLCRARTPEHCKEIEHCILLSQTSCEAWKRSLLFLGSGACWYIIWLVFVDLVELRWT